MGSPMGDAHTTPLLDTHVHFWDHSVPGMSWPWLQPGFNHREVQDTHVLDAPRYAAPEFREETHGAGVGGVIHMHASDPAIEPSSESAWLQSMAEEHGCPDAIVGLCLLAEPDAPDVLRRHSEFSLVRGVRDITAARHFEPDEVTAALAVVAELGYSVELRVAPERFGVLRELAERWPEITFLLSHGGLPLGRSAAERRDWSAALRDLARAPNFICKISAIGGASDPDWTVGTIRPWVLECIEIFGVERCVLGTNWPIDRLFSTYRQLVDSYRHIAGSALDPAEQAALFHGNAERIYRVTVT